jgi:hypothetical protein
MKLGEPSSRADVRLDVAVCVVVEPEVLDHPLSETASGPVAIKFCLREGGGKV